MMVDGTARYVTQISPRPLLLRKDRSALRQRAAHILSAVARDSAPTASGEVWRVAENGPNEIREDIAGANSSLPQLNGDALGEAGSPAQPATAPDAGKAITNLSQQAQNTAQRAADAGPSPDQAAQAVDSASSNIAQQADNAARNASLTDSQGSGTGLLNGLNDAVSSASKSVSDAASSIRDSIAGTISGGQQSISGGGDELQKQVQELTSGLTQNFEGAKGDVGKQILGLSDAAGTALQDASTGLDSLRDAASGAAGDLSNQALQQANSALSTLPAPLRDTIQAILNPIAQVTAFRNTALILAVGYPSYQWFTARFGGFAGRLSPLVAQKVLENENALLLDIRPDTAREIAGIPELRLGARNKGLALPLLRVKQKTGTQVVKANVLSFQVAALLVNGLGKVSDGTKIIILGDSETQAVKLARAITEEVSLKAYVLKDGFTGWTRAELPVSEESEYENGPLVGITGNVQGQLASFFRDPVTVISAIFLVLALSAALIDEHKTLQYIGAFGLTITIGSIPVRYNSLQEARDDILGPFLKVVNSVLNLVPKSQTTSSQALPPSSESSLRSLPPGDDGYGDILKEGTGSTVATKSPDSPEPGTSQQSPPEQPKVVEQTRKPSPTKNAA